MKRQPGTKKVTVQVGYVKGSQPEYQRKRTHKGKACRRDKPIYYDEKKKNCNLMLTPTALSVLQELALQHGISRSEVVEQWLRGILPSLLGGPKTDVI